MQTIQISINGDSVTYHARQTTAPRAYDGFGTIELKDLGTERIVLIRDEHLNWQTMRYSSGLHTPTEVEAPVEYIIDELWQRLNGNAS